MLRVVGVIVRVVLQDGVVGHRRVADGVAGHQALILVEVAERVHGIGQGLREGAVDGRAQGDQRHVDLVGPLEFPVVRVAGLGVRHENAGVRQDVVCAGSDVPDLHRDLPDPDADRICDGAETGLDQVADQLDDGGDLLDDPLHQRDEHVTGVLNGVVAVHTGEVGWLEQVGEIGLRRHDDEVGYPGFGQFPAAVEVQLVQGDHQPVGRSDLPRQREALRHREGRRRGDVVEQFLERPVQAVPGDGSHHRGQLALVDLLLEGVTLVDLRVRMVRERFDQRGGDRVGHPGGHLAVHIELLLAGVRVVGQR